MSGTEPARPTPARIAATSPTRFISNLPASPRFAHDSAAAPRCNGEWKPVSSAEYTPRQSAFSEDTHDVFIQISAVDPRRCGRLLRVAGKHRTGSRPGTTSTRRADVGSNLQERAGPERDPGR